MRRSPLLATVVLLTALLLATPLYAAPINCKLASTPREKAVCSDPGLLQLDHDLAETFDRLQIRLSPESAASVKSDQRSWLAWLDHVCSQEDSRFPPNTCLRNQYDQRAQQLKKGTTAGSGPTIYTRAMFRIAPGKADAKSEINPGYGTAAFSWPQIDRPTAQQERWNNAVETAILPLITNPKQLSSAVRPEPKPQSFLATLDSAADPDSEIVLTYSLKAANERFVDVDLVRYQYSYGAAHGITDSQSFLWWLDRERRLQTSDLFRDGSNWQLELIARSIRKLQADPDLQPMLWKDKDLQVGASGAVQPSHWTVTQSGLTISFAQYEVAAYAAGGGSVQFTWQELQPLLAPSLDPNTLPAAIPHDNESPENNPTQKQ